MYLLPPLYMHAQQITDDDGMGDVGTLSDCLVSIAILPYLLSLSLSPPPPSSPHLLESPLCHNHLM